MEIPNSVTSIGEGAFSGCSSLNEILVEEGSKNFVSDSGVLYNYDKTILIQCPGAKTSCEIPNSVKEIGYAAFYGCSSLTSVAIPNSVKEIGYVAFSSCSSLTNVYYMADELIESNDFLGKTYDNATLYLSEEGIKQYKYKAPWKNFKNVKIYDFNGVEEIIADFNADEPYEVFDLNGMKVGDNIGNLPPRIYIVRQGGESRKIAVR